MLFQKLPYIIHLTSFSLSLSLHLRTLGFLQTNKLSESLVSLSLRKPFFYPSIAIKLLSMEFYRGLNFLSSSSVVREIQCTSLLLSNYFPAVRRTKCQSSDWPFLDVSIIESFGTMYTKFKCLHSAFITDWKCFNVFLPTNSYTTSHKYTAYEACSEHYSSNFLHIGPASPAARLVSSVQNVHVLGRWSFEHIAPIAAMVLVTSIDLALSLIPLNSHFWEDCYKVGCKNA